MITKLTIPGPDCIPSVGQCQVKDPVNVLGGCRDCIIGLYAHTIGRFIRRIKPKSSPSANAKERDPADASRILVTSYHISAAVVCVF